MSISLEVIPLGPVAVGARAWRHRKRRLLTAIVKASFSINHDGAMSVTQPAPVVTEERHYRNNPVASLVRASDLALLVPKPEVVVVGHAYAGPGQKLQNTTVRLALARGTSMLINKRLEIVGDRRARPGETPPDPSPFEKIPVLYERALGGIASRDNPVGVGMATDGDGLLTLPNVQLPAGGGVQPVGLGPIPSAWPIRQKKRGSLSWAAANTMLDVDVPDDFDDAYYQTAPADQQVSELLGGDLIAIVNMHPEIGTLRCFLPAARAVAMAQTKTGERLPLTLRIDTVHIQPDMMRAEIVYRGATVVNDEQLQHIRLAGALEEPDAPFTFPDLATVGGLVAQPGARMPSQIDLGSTAVIAEEPPPPAQRMPVAPAPQPGPARGHAGTMIIEPDAPAAAAPARTPPPPPAPLPQKSPNQSTLVIEPEFEPQSLPFHKKEKPAGRGGTTELETRAPTAATPWGDSRAVQIRPAATSLTSTLAMEDTEDGSDYLEDPPTDVRDEEPAPVAVSARRAAAAVQEKPVSSADLPTPRAGPSAPSTPPPPPAAAPAPPSEPPPPPPEPKPAPVVQPPKPNVASALYKRFKK